ncbi:MAG: 16S rRNA (uracil(1498)-N(3))-methyltransferase [Deltaproteobacteria bacterium]|nr:16S rRNA (uracil(1498)-N(3))-methyltransferase [Deltaproteobacteria bacterium]
MPQFLLDPGGLAPDARSAVLTGAEAHHLLRVVRTRPGDRVKLFDGRGRRWQGRLAAGGAPDAARVEALEPLPSHEPSLELRLAQSLPKGDRWTWLLEKGTELGVSHFAPLRSRYTVVTPAAGKAQDRRARWTAIALAAAKQCERGVVPDVAEAQDLDAFLSGLGAPAAAEVRLVCLERSTAPPPALAGRPAHVTVAVGPEGGWSPEEVEALQRAAFLPLSLGPRLLRAETAGVAALVWVLARWGDLVAPGDP